MSTGEQKEKYEKPTRVKRCRVSFRDSEGIEHAVELEARTLYEAVGLAIDRFRRCEHVSYEQRGSTNSSWNRGSPAPNTD